MVFSQQNFLEYVLPSYLRIVVMKRLFLVSLILVSFQAAIAQQVDLVVSGLHITSDTNNLIPGGVVSSAAISIQNIDSTIVESGDTIHFSMGINGTIYTGMEVLTSDLGPGEELYYNFGDSNLYSFSDTGGIHLVYGAVMYTNDTVGFNDLLIDTFQTTVFVSNDWSSDSFEIVLPSNLDGFDIDNGTNVPPNVSEAEITFRNNGAVTYLQYSSFKYRIYLGNESMNVIANLYQGDIAPGETNVRNVTNQALFPSIPNSVGTYQICAEVTEPISAGASGCFGFEIIDTWDPTDPDNWPHGLSSMDRDHYSFVNSTDRMFFRDVTEPLDVWVFNLNGTRVHQFSISSDSEISTCGLSSGIYFLEVHSNNKVLGQEKVVRF